MVVRNFHLLENKFVLVIYFVRGSPKKLVEQQTLLLLKPQKRNNHFFWARWRGKILSRQRAQKTFIWLKIFFLVSDSIRLKSKVAFKYVCLNSKLLFFAETQTQVYIHFSNETQTRALVFWFCCRLKPKIFWLSFGIKIFENKKRKFLHVLDFSKIQTET